jgi:hypothetical protein
MLDFNVLATQLHSASPTGTNSAQYTPVNTAKRTCPTVDSHWQVAPTGLPLTPSRDWCSCMVSTLSCQAKSTLTDGEISFNFGWICGGDGFGSCKGFTPDTTTGSYPDWGICNPIDKLSLAFNALYQHYGSQASACDFTGNATLMTPTKSMAACAPLLNVTVAAGTSTGGTAGPAATTASASGSTKTSNSPTASGAKKSSAAHVGLTPPFSFIVKGAGIYILGLIIIAGKIFIL